MTDNLIQYSFAAGEISETLYGRVDLAKYRTGAAMMENWFVDFRGGATTRAGSKLVGRTKYSDRNTRLVGFRFSSNDNSVLEFGDEYMRIIQNGGYVVEASKAITDASVGAGGIVFTSAAHGYTAGDWIVINGVQGTVGAKVNGKTFVVLSTTTDIFRLGDYAGNNIDGTGLAYTSGGTVERIYELATPYDHEDLALLKFTQSADTVTITHMDYAPRDLIRNDSTDWTLEIIPFGETVPPPTNVTLTRSSGDDSNAYYIYAVTTVTDEGESIESQRKVVDIALMSSAQRTVSVSWTQVPDAKYYNVYRSVGIISPSSQADLSLFLGFVGNAFGGSFKDTNISPDFTRSPQRHDNPFEDNNWPSVASYYQQRKVYAASREFPQTVWGSRPAEFRNFNISIPTTADDAYEFTLVSQQLNNIKHMISMPGGLVILTGGSAWQLNGGGQNGNAPLTPLNVQATPQAYNGCNDVPPININYDLLYIQQKGNIVRDLAYNLFANVYTGTDISILSNHLFVGHEIKEWAYAEEPFKTIWCVREDGRALSLCFLKEQEIYGWAPHSTQGLYKSVTTVQEQNIDATYWVVRRFIDGEWVQFTERSADRLIPTVEDSWCVDCGLEYPLGWQVSTCQPAALEGNAVSFKANVATFTADMVGWVIRGGGGKAVITQYVSPTEVVAKIERAIVETLPQTDYPMEFPIGGWSVTKPTTVVSGLEHLEGMEVAILADGGVLPRQVVTDGKVTLSRSASRVIVGLPYTCTLQTLAVDVGEPTIQGKRKKVSKIIGRINQTRGLKYGTRAGNMVEAKERNTQQFGQPIELGSFDQHVNVDAGWSAGGRVLFVQDNPLPASVLAVILEITVG